MTDFEHSNADDVLNRWFRKEQEVAGDDAPLNPELWQGIEQVLGEDAASDEPLPDVDDGFLCAYADGLLSYDAPEVVAFERHMARMPEALEKIADFQEVSSRVRRYACRAEAGCTINVVTSVMRRLQVLTHPRFREKTPWIALPVATAAAVLLVMMSGSVVGDAEAGILAPRKPVAAYARTVQHASVRLASTTSSTIPSAEEYALGTCQEVMPDETEAMRMIMYGCTTGI